MPAPGDAYGNEVWVDTPAWWPRLDETSGTSSADYMGGAAGTYGGTPALNQTPLILTGKSVLFDGVDDSVSFADAAAQRPANITIEAWVRPDAAIVEFAPAVLKANAAWTNGYGLVWVGGKLRWFINNYNVASASLSNHIDATISTAATHHIVGTFDGSQMRLYADGAEVAGSPVSMTAAINHDATAPLRVGFDGAGDFWKGKIDEPAVYSTVLASGRVATHYTAGSGQTLFVDMAGASTAGGFDSGALSVDSGTIEGGVPLLTLPLTVTFQQPARTVTFEKDRTLTFEDDRTLTFG